MVSIENESAPMILEEHLIPVALRVAWALVAGSALAEVVLPGLAPEFQEAAVAASSGLFDGGVEFPPGVPQWVRDDLELVGKVAAVATEAVVVGCRHPDLRTVVAFQNGEQVAMVLPGTSDASVMALARDDAATVLFDVVRRYHEGGQDWSAVRHLEGATVVAMSARRGEVRVGVGENRTPPETLEQALILLLASPR